MSYRPRRFPRHHRWLWRSIGTYRATMGRTMEELPGDIFPIIAQSMVVPFGPSVAQS